MTNSEVLNASEKDREPQEGFRCPQCGAEIPEKAYQAIMEKVACNEHAECDYCPY